MRSTKRITASRLGGTREEDKISHDDKSSCDEFIVIFLIEKMCQKCPCYSCYTLQDHCNCIFLVVLSVSRLYQQHVYNDGEVTGDCEQHFHSLWPLL